MKRKITTLVIAFCLLLCGCDSFFDGHYASVKPHELSNSTPQTGNVSAATYNQLYNALIDLVEAGTESGVITVARYDTDKLSADMQRAVDTVRKQNPIAAYAVKQIEFELGRSGGQPALAVTIDYAHDRAEILKIRQVNSMEEAQTAICSALNRCDVSIVLQVQNYREMDLVQVVESYAFTYPDSVMERPDVTVSVYPASGKVRVVEVKFGYQTSRDSLREMQSQVEPIFNSAVLYVSGDAEDQEKYSQLYSFLMERYDYQIQTSITPTYSLLRHGVGDSRAFAVVYAAMCRRAELECLVVSGTRAGESRYWNIICDAGMYYHVDLLAGSYIQLTDEEMTDYVWDYSAYPECGPAPSEQEEEN